MGRIAFSLHNAGGGALQLAPPYYTLAFDGLGLADPEYATEAGPYQDGESIVNARWKSRTITIGVNIAADDDDAYEAARQALINILGTIRQDVYFRATYPDGRQRQLDTRYLAGLTLPIEASAGMYRTKSAFQLLAYRPLWYDPVTLVWSFALGSGDSSFKWATSWPVGWGVSTIDSSETKLYPGTWDDLPIIEITGPADDLVIENESTGEKLDFTGHDIDASEVVTLDLRYGRKSLTSSTGNTTLAHLTNDSDLGTFHVAADPDAPGGLNIFRVACTGAQAGTLIQMRLNPKYKGI